MPTSVVNIRTGAKCDVYIGRPGPFGNPFVIGPDGDRSEVIEKFRDYFHERMKLDPAWKTKVEAIRGKKLGCYCSPLGCHGDVYVAFLEGLPGQDAVKLLP